MPTHPEELNNNNNNNDNNAQIMDANAEAEFAQYHSYDNFLRLHQSQLQAMKFPAQHYRQLYDKIYAEKFDAVEDFAVCQEEDKIGYECIALRTIAKDETVWIIDHSWTAPLEGIVEALREDEEMWPRLEAIVDTEHYNALEETQHQQESEISSIPEDNENIRVIANEYHTTYAHAYAVWKEHNEDVIETAQALQQERDQRSSSATASTDAKPISDKEKRVKKLYERLREGGFIGAYNVTAPREGGGQLRPEDVATIYYINDEIGSAITKAYANESECNCNIAPLVLVTMNGSALSVLWLTKDIEENEVLKAPYKKVIPEPPQWKTQYETS